MPAALAAFTAQASRGPMKEEISRAISTLNSLAIGDMDRIRRRLQEVQCSLQEMGQPELRDLLSEAITAVGRGDVPLFRSRVHQVVSRLGHLR